MESGMGLDGGQSIVHPPNPANPAQPRWGHTSWCSFSKAMNWHNWGHFFTPTRDSASHFCTQCSLNRLKTWSWWKSSSPEIPGISKASTCLDKWGLKAKDWNKGQTKNPLENRWWFLKEVIFLFISSCKGSTQSLEWMPWLSTKISSWSILLFSH